MDCNWAGLASQWVDLGPSGPSVGHTPGVDVKNRQLNVLGMAPGLNDPFTDWSPIHQGS